VPELPDVEVKKNYLVKTSLKKKIADVRVLDKRILGDNTTPAGLAKALKGATFKEATRRAKYLLVFTDRDDTLLMHFGMTGDLVFENKAGDKPKYDRVEYRFGDGSTLYYENMRLFGKVALFHTTDFSEIPDIAKLGPEPLDRSFTFKKFKDILDKRSTTIHQVLMEQELIAGIGNIFSDEITYQAGVRPDRKVSSLSDKELRKLFDKMKWVLKRAIELDADLDGHPKQFIIPNRGPKGTCPRSDTPLVKKTLGGRSSYYCPDCQK